MHLSHRILISIGVLLCVAALLAACGGESATPVPTDGGQTGTEAEPAAPTALPTGSEFVSPLQPELSPLPTPTEAHEAEPDEPPTGPVPIEITLPAAAPLAGEVPQELLDAVFDDLVEQLGASREAIEVKQAGAVVWRDGSLGCPQPGMMYTQALVPGFQIVLRAGDEVYDYHASDRGYFILCAEGMAEEGLPPGEGGLVDQ